MEQIQWEKLPKYNALIARVLYDYYWMHRSIRVSKIHKFCCMDFKELEAITNGSVVATEKDVEKVIAGLHTVLTKYTSITKQCQKELIDGIGREHGES